MAGQQGAVVMKSNKNKKRDMLTENTTTIAIIMLISNLIFYALIKRFYGEDIGALALVTLVLMEFIIIGHIIFKPKKTKRQ